MRPACGRSCRSGPRGRKNSLKTHLRLIAGMAALLMLFPFGGKASAVAASKEKWRMEGVEAGEEASAVSETPIVLRDTLRTEKQRRQFRQALALAPKHFACDKYTSDGVSRASATRLRFNDTMRNVLKFDFVREDEFLYKQMRRLYLVTRPFGVTGDLSVRYKTLSGGGIAVEYTISNLCIWGRRASDRLIREILTANGA